MKKERNTFFSNYNAQTQSYIPNFPNNMNQAIIPDFNPYTGTSVNSNFYSGPDIDPNEIDNRFSKIERQLNRLDNRLNKLESSLNKPQDVTENNYSNNMYML